MTYPFHAESPANPAVYPNSSSFRGVAVDRGYPSRWQDRSSRVASIDRLLTVAKPALSTFKGNTTYM